MAEVYDQWHKSRPRKGDKPCGQHTAKGRVLAPTAVHGQGKRWQVRWRDASGEQRKENFEKRAKADTRAATIEADLARGVYVDPAAGKATFRSAAERWQKAANHRGTTASRVERALRLHVYPTFGDRAVATIRPSEVQGWVKERSGHLAPSTLKVTLSYVVSVFLFLVRDGDLGRNPCEGIKVSDDTPTGEIVPLHPDAVRALIDAVPARYRALVLLAASSGLRQGELFGLEVEDVDFLRREVRVRQQLIGPDGGLPFLGPPKTRESYRTVPLTKSAVDAVAAHLAAHPVASVEIEDRTDKRKHRTRKARLIFVNGIDHAIRRGAWSHMWENAEQRANKALAKAHAKVKPAPGQNAAPAVTVPAGASIHDLRHFYASMLIKHRESVKTVQKRLGHSKPSITLDIYTHLWPDDEDTTRDAVEAVLGVVPAMCPVEQAI